MCNYVHVYMYKYNIDIIHNVIIYMGYVRMYEHATHVQQPCLLSPSVFFFCVPYVAAVGGAPFVSPGSVTPRKCFCGDISVARSGVPYRSALQRISWRKMSQFWTEPAWRRADVEAHVDAQGCNISEFGNISDQPQDGSYGAWDDRKPSWIEPGNR